MRVKITHGYQDNPRPWELKAIPITHSWSAAEKQFLHVMLLADGIRSEVSSNISFSLQTADFLSWDPSNLLLLQHAGRFLFMRQATISLDLQLILWPSGS